MQPDWTRREIVRGLAAAALAMAARAAGAQSPLDVAPREREVRRRWALARMDEMARERLRCGERHRKPDAVRECQAGFERRHRAYNEIYIEAARE